MGLNLANSEKCVDGTGIGKKCADGIWMNSTEGIDKKKFSKKPLGVKHLFSKFNNTSVS